MKVRVYNPQTGKILAFNTDQVTKWETDNLVKAGTNERAPGFALHIHLADGSKAIVYHDRGGQELLEALKADFIPLNEPPKELQP